MSIFNQIVFGVILGYISVYIFSCMPSVKLESMRYSGEVPVIRVLLDQVNFDGVVKFRSKGYIFVNGNYFTNVVEISSKGGKIFIGKVEIETNSVEIYSDELVYKDIVYPGIIRVILTNRSILVINVVDLETYLKGVLPNEVIPSWNFEALKAQAVVSRTYALRKVVDGRNSIFDVYSDYRSQVYKGFAKLHQRTSRAVDETRGIVITHQGKVIYAFFHANSGGYVEDSIFLTKTKFPYLEAKMDRFSKGTLRSTWEAFVELERFSRILDLKGSLERVEISYNFSGRSVKSLILFLKDENGVNKVEVSTYQLRELFPEILSSKFSVTLLNRVLRFRGYGWGHGVGLSQWGAMQMAESGYNYKEILKFYYKDIELSRGY